MNTQITLTNAEWTSTVQRTYRSLVAPSIAFKPAFAKLTGSTTAALLLSQGYYWCDGRTSQEDGWFYKTAEQWTEELYLSQREQTGAREKLRAIHLVDPEGNEIPIWEERLRGVPAVLHYRVNEVALALALTIMDQNGKPVGGYKLVAPDCLLNSAHDIQKRETSLYKSAKLDSTKARNCTIYTETTTENTAETAPAVVEPAKQAATSPVAPTTISGSMPNFPIPDGPSPNDILGRNGRDGYRKRMNGFSSVDHAQTCTKQAGEMGLTPQAWVAYYKRLADICGLTAVLDLDESDRLLVDLRDGAIRLLKLDLRNVEALNALASLWKEENSWRANPTPTLRALAEFQSRKLGEMKAQAEKATALDDNPMVEVEEWLYDSDGNGGWWPDTMRRKRYEKLAGEGRKIRLVNG